VWSEDEPRLKAEIMERWNKEPRKGEARDRKSEKLVAGFGSKGYK